MASLRIYEPTRKLNVSSEELIQALKKDNISVKSHMSTVTGEITAAAEKRFGKSSAALKTKTAPQKKTAPKKTEQILDAGAKRDSKPAEKASPKTVAKTPQKPGEKPAQKAPQKSVEKPAQRSAQKPVSKPVQKQIEKPIQKPPERSAQKPAKGAPKSKPDKPKAKPTSPRKPDSTRPIYPSHPDKRRPPLDDRRRKPPHKAKLSTIEAQQKAVRDSVRRTLAKLEVTRKTKRRKEKQKFDEIADDEPTKVAQQVSVRDLAAQFGVDATEILRKCLELGIPATINQRLDRDIIELLAEDYSKTVDFDTGLADEITSPVSAIDPSKLKPRAPIVTVMGHVDHGKTSILDFIRKSNVAGGEAGGITQHIGAYSIETDHGDISFVDTPGHEAFTSMRARGASVTDVVVLVVAADDGIMPQTLEAINHARAAGVPIVVAINKIDLPGALPDRVKQQLSERNILVEDFGGDVVCQEVSAKTGEGINKLLELISLQAELLELRAQVEGPASGVVVEVKKEEGRGILCTLIVKQGTLKIGNVFVAGEHYGKVRALLDHRGAILKLAGPSTPVVVLGCNGLPNAGDNFTVVRDEKEARDISLKKQDLQRVRDMRSSKKLTLEELYQQIQQGELKELGLIVKGDMDGSVEALNESLIELSNAEVKVNIIHSGVGFITESDVLLAASSRALIIGFNVKASPKAEELAQKEQVEIRHYNIIYECLSEVKDAMIGMLEPEIIEKVLGRAEVRKVFRISRLGTIAGSMVIEGTITRNSMARVLRQNEIVFEGKVSSLKRFHDDVKDVQKDFECGIGVGGFSDIREGDIVETFIIEEKSKISL